MDEDIALAVWVGRLPALMAATPQDASPLPLTQARSHSSHHVHPKKPCKGAMLSSCQHLVSSSEGDQGRIAAHAVM